MASPAAPGLFFCFAAMVLLIFVSVSAPTWNRISFLDAVLPSNPGTTTHFGCFGYTGSGTSIGYHFNQTVLGFSDTRLQSTTIFNLTRALILHPIAAGLSFLCVLFGLCGLSYHRTGTILMSILSLITTLVVLVAWVIDMVLFGILRDRIRDNASANSNSNSVAQYGNANWLTLGALVALVLGFCVGFCGIFGRYRSRRVANTTTAPGYPAY